MIKPLLSKSPASLFSVIAGCVRGSHSGLSSLSRTSARALSVGFLLCVSGAGLASAAPSAVGKYAGISADGGTLISFETTRRGYIRNLKIVGLRALCTTTIPGLPEQPLEERSTNIRRNETPLIRLRATGNFSDEFDLIDPNRMDFRDARVSVSGSLSGKRGRIQINIEMDKTYEDGSREVCGGSVTMRVRHVPRL